MYIPSTAPGKTWDVCITNLSDRPKEAYAIEGVRDEISFQTKHPGSRITSRFPIHKPATAKRKRAAMIEVAGDLLRNDAITYLDYTAALIEIRDNPKVIA